MKLILIAVSIFTFVSHASAGSCNATVKCQFGSAECATQSRNTSEQGKRTNGECGLSNTKYLACIQPVLVNGTTTSTYTQYICCTASGTAFVTDSKSDANAMCAGLQ